MEDNSPIENMMRRDKKKRNSTRGGYEAMRSLHHNIGYHMITIPILAAFVSISTSMPVRSRVRKKDTRIRIRIRRGRNTETLTWNWNPY